MKNLNLLTIAIFVLFVFNNSSVQAILGNTINQNIPVLGSNNVAQKYNCGGSKNVLIYKKNNSTITVVYKDKISILEDISYNEPVSDENAQKDIINLILPYKSEKPSYKSNVIFSDGYYEEKIYKSGIKIKVIYNKENKATEVVSSMVQFANKTTNDEQ